MTTFPRGPQLTALTLAAAAGLAAASCEPARAAAFYLQDQSVLGLGRAYSGEAADLGAASLWYNPAAIAGAGGEVYVGSQGLLVSSKVTNTATSITRPIPPAGLTTPVGGETVANDPVANGLIPNFAFAAPLGDRFAVGVSAAAPFDFTSQYDSLSFARYNGLKSRLTTEDLQLTGAMKVTPWLNLGIGFDTEYTSANLSQAYPNLSPLLADGQSDLKGQGYNYGYTAGAQVHFARWSLGASYRSAMDHDLDGRVEISGLDAPLAGANALAPGRAQFRTPWIATLGGRYRLSDRLTLDAQVERFGWSEFSGIYVTSSAGDQVIPTNYHDTTSGALGLDYQVTPRWTLRGGVGYDQSPIPDGERSSLVPDSDRELYTVGSSVQVAPRLTLDAAFGYIAFNGAKVSDTQVFYAGTAAQTVVAEQGAVAGNAKLLSLGIRYHF